MISQILGKIRTFTLDTIAPRTCPSCGKVMLTTETAMCIDCLTALPRTGFCGTQTPLRELVDNGVAEPGPCAAWFFYDSAAHSAEIIRTAKFRDRPALARELGRLFGKELLTNSNSGIERTDVLLPVPMHWIKRLRRGYNQSVEIARGISDVTGIPVIDNLESRKPHRTQSLQSARARLGNLEGKMALRYPSELDGLNIAVVDDIITTGSTIRECVRAVSSSGARPASIGVYAIAMVNR